jgi:hypothetical protein
MSREFGFEFCETIYISHFEWNMVPLGVSSIEEISGKSICSGTRYNRAYKAETVKMATS